MAREAPRPAPTASVADAGPVDAGDPLPSLESLAAEQAVLAPGLREIARGETDERSGRQEIVRAVHDTCVRVRYAASHPVRARLESASGIKLSDPPAAASGALAKAGPVCIRAGDAVELVFEAEGAFRARFVAWSSR